ncbi:hypothetical protein M407DRAFT_7201 [Tulasnella calospora MUT 4182]|uniref:Cyanovirin-N domain-containing protein n=1 Tax=Tulasnella calospora MUT 4182 TaxID=1051891 RepID=A0A0C3M1L3_9AGAM|nr:hypothetical protein M407DRAFT_7201 [Tulasnella calospora MUT 4182]
MAFSLSSTNVRLDGTTIRAKCKTKDGKLVDSALDLNLHIGNKEGNFSLSIGLFGASASDIRLDGSTLHAVLATSKQVKAPKFIDLNACLENINGALTFVKPKQRITQSCSAIIFQGSTLKGLCLGSDGKLHPSTIELNGCYSNDDGRFVPGGSAFTTARRMDLVSSGGKVILRGQLRSRDDGWRNAEVDLSVGVVNTDGKLHFVKEGGKFDQDGPVTLSFDLTPFARTVVDGLPLLAGNEVWAKRVAAFCANSPIICVTLVLGSLFGGPIGSIVSAGIITPIGLVVESGIADVIKDPVLKAKYEEAIVGRFICETISHMLVDNGAELLVEAVGELAVLDVETAVAEVRGVFRGAKVAVAELGSYRLLKKVVDAVCKKQTPQDWLETLEKVEKLKQA